MASTPDSINPTANPDLENLVKMAASNPQSSIEIIEKELKEEMLGSFNLDLIKK